jgi:hydrogenase maturation protein HypF
LSTAQRRVRARVTGVVQGVGFRPYVYRLASELSLDGYVLNDETGVLAEASGPAADIEAFLARLPAEAPPLAVVEAVAVEELAANGAPPHPGEGFAIVESASGGEPSALIAADSATCADCLAELLDPADRRHRYPFVNCTNCGPRFTIVKSVPYDRPATTMAAFTMCAACQAEYDDPRDRRFHAQPNACWDCGPQAALTAAADGKPLAEPGDASVRAAAEALRAGGVIAVKGLGGYHLACLAGSEPAVAALRSRKHREHKPFALMVADVACAETLCELTPEAQALLAAPERPIVLAPRRSDAPVAASVAPRSQDLGVMLAYTPLHHLLLADLGGPAMVMTSANVSDEPIAYLDGDARERLAGIADAFLAHDRAIHIRTDDSVARMVSTAGGRTVGLPMRRSRGYVPRHVDIPVELARPLLACGAELKSTFCVAKGRRAWLSHHIGDLKNWETLESFREGVEHFERVFAVAPEIVAHDLHPDYLSTRYALEREDVELVAVQHHHAHMAGCLAEHGERGPAIGAIFDGTGYGPDGTIWGGELLVGDLTSFERAGHLHPVRMLGGDAAVRQPWRMACAWLAAALGEPPPLPAPLDGRVDPAAWEAVAALAFSELASPVTTSAGRLFDAVSALCGICPDASYDGQAAAELEGAVDAGVGDAYALPVVTGADGVLVLDARALVSDVLDDLTGGTAAPVVAARFHNGLAAGTAEACASIASARGLSTVALSGGVFQNRIALERTAAALRASGLRVAHPERLPPNDGAIAYGQAVVAAASRSRSSLERGLP